MFFSTVSLGSIPDRTTRQPARAAKETEREGQFNIFNSLSVMPTVQRLLSIAGECLPLSVHFPAQRRRIRTSGFRPAAPFRPLSELPIWPPEWVACSPPWPQCADHSRTGNGRSLAGCTGDAASARSIHQYCACS